MTSHVPIILTVLLLFACTPDPLPQVFDDYKATPRIQQTSEEIDDIKQDLTEAADQITDSTESIRASLAEIQGRFPDDLRTKIKKPAKAIRNQTDLIDEQAMTVVIQEHRLTQQQQELQTASAAIGQMERYVREFQTAADDAIKKAEQVQAERDEAVERANSSSRAMLRYLILICTIGGGAGIAVMVFGKFATGGLIAVASFSTLVFAIAVEQYFNFIALGGVGIILLAVAYLVYMVFIRERAVEEIVETAEAAKRRMDGKMKIDLFGDDKTGKAGHVKLIQSDTTEQLVKGVRQRFQARWAGG